MQHKLQAHFHFICSFYLPNRTDYCFSLIAQVALLSLRLALFFAAFVVASYWFHSRFTDLLNNGPKLHLRNTLPMCNLISFRIVRTKRTNQKESRQVWKTCTLMKIRCSLINSLTVINRHLLWTRGRYHSCSRSRCAQSASFLTYRVNRDGECSTERVCPAVSSCFPQRKCLFIIKSDCLPLNCHF